MAHLALFLGLKSDQLEIWRVHLLCLEPPNQQKDCLHLFRNKPQLTSASNPYLAGHAQFHKHLH